MFPDHHETTTCMEAVSERIRRAREPQDAQVTVITPQRGWFDWRLGQLWRYRELIGLFVWRDFVSVYKQTILGPSWHVVRPLLATFVFTLVFGRMAGMSTDGVPQFLFYLTGYVLWTYFATCLDNVSKTFMSHQNILGKVYFHRLVIPLSLLISNLVALGIQIALLGVVLAGYLLLGASVHPTMWLALVPLIVLIVGGYALGFGIIVCAVTTRYRDLSYFVAFAIQLLMYLTPVVYPASAVSAGYRSVVLLNPLTPAVEAFRQAFLGAGSVTALQLALSGLGMVLILVGGLMMFSRAEKTFMDTV